MSPKFALAIELLQLEMFKEKEAMRALDRAEDLAQQSFNSGSRLPVIRELFEAIQILQAAAVTPEIPGEGERA